MIARRLRMNTPSKSSITRLIAYLTNSQGSSNRVQDVRITGCESEDATWASMEMLAVQQQNTRAKSDKTYHCMISFQEGEHPSPEEIAEIEQRFCESLGYGSHQRVSVLHGDTEHFHLHIAINKIHPEKLTIHEPFYDHKELARVCTEVERQYGLGVDNHTFRTQARPNAAINMERAGDIESLTGWIQRTCLADLKDARDWKTFGAVLAKHGLTLKARGNGLVFASGELHVKASSIDRSLSKTSLEKRLGRFEGISPSSSMESQKTYERKPLSAGASRLWSEYQGEEQERQNKRERLRQERMEQREEAVKDFRLRNLLIKNMTSGILNKLILYRLSRNRLKKQLQKKQWIDWLRTKAGQSHPVGKHSLREKQGAASHGADTVLRILDFGKARYRFNPEERESFFIRVERQSGSRAVIWGTDLERAVAESGMAIGDRISLHKIGAEAVSVHQRQEDGQGHVEKARIAGQRNQWRIDVLSKRISEEALAYLQSRYEGHSSYLRGIERHPLEAETITRKGTRIFAEGVKENGGRLFVSRQATDAELRCIMGFAERHYKDVTIHAPDTLCARMKGGITQHPEQKRTQEQSQDEGYGR